MSGRSLKALVGLNHNQSANTLKEVAIDNGQQCLYSNVGQMGVWLSEVTSSTTGKLKISYQFFF